MHVFRSTGYRVYRTERREIKILYCNCIYAVDNVPGETGSRKARSRKTGEASFETEPERRLPMEST